MESLDSFALLQNILCCPLGKSPLRLMPLTELLGHLPENERKRVAKRTVGAFVSEYTMLAYPIIGNIISFLEQDTLRLSEAKDSCLDPADSEAWTTKQSVKKWYDEFGWRRNEAGIYGDVSLYAGIGQTGFKHYELLTHLSLTARLSPGGESLLDAACGAIALPEYLSYCWSYNYRFCVDISLTALEEACRKIGEKGIYILADICCLPFLDKVFDGIISGYTIQHIPESEQYLAIKELYRVLKPNKHLYITAHIKPTRIRRILLKKREC